MYSDDVAISVRNLSKSYRLFDHPGDRIKQFLSLGLKRYHRQFTALHDITFDIRRGETVGIIGRNGSGKSTLLQLICGILKPTSGTVRVKGRISALLELGSGFNPEFTGRENIYFQGMLMGLSKAQMDERFDDIAAFADIGDFIDQPVRMYSSGMFVRLAFAVAVSVDPDILVVDEALAVGDARFQSKCFRRIQNLSDEGGLILFVTHATNQVTRFCNRAILIEGGRLIENGEPKAVVNHHLASVFDSPAPIDKPSIEPSGADFTHRPGYNAAEYRFGSGGAEILDFKIFADGGSPGELRFMANRRIGLMFRVAFHQAIERATYAVAISTPDGVNLFGANSRDIDRQGSSGPFEPGDIVEARFDLSLYLARGEYLISLSVSEEVGVNLEPLDRRYDSIVFSVDSSLEQRGVVDMMPSFSLEAVEDVA